MSRFSTLEVQFNKIEPDLVLACELFENFHNSCYKCKMDYIPCEQLRATNMIATLGLGKYINYWKGVSYE